MSASRSVRRVLSVALRVSAACLAAAAAWPAAAAEAVPVPVLNWQPCADQQDAGFLCSTARVPIDYSDPEGGSFSLALIKHSADDSKNRIGTLFWNPGGPSDSGTQYMPIAIGGFPAQVTSRFDIVSWDPRGMGGDTTPVVQCFNSASDEATFTQNLYAGLPAIPVSPSDLAKLSNARTTLNQACVAREGSLLAHVSTADNARDLDLLRQAVGDAKISYYGTSYGTFLGATYLNMFPGNVRAAVLDGAVYPTAWAGTGKDSRRLSTFVRIGSDIGSSETVTAFLAACGEAGVASCPFAAPKAEATQEKYQSLLESLRTNPVTIDGQAVDDTAVISYFQSSIFIIHPVPGFDRFPGYVAVAQFLQDVWSATNAGGQSSAAAQAAPAAVSTASQAATYTTSYGRQAAVICGESPNPATVTANVKQALFSDRRAGLTAWPLLAICLGWSIEAAETYSGPWNTPTPPVLVVGNTFDPATPYSSSRRMAAELYDGHFLTVDGFGHTELLNPSRCAQDAIAAYLTDGTLPPDGARCAQDYRPFSR
nr:alpha/beta hydrolase [uncultured Rhodopila sp.]